MRNTCEVDNCLKYVKAHGLCSTHDSRMRRNGTIELIERSMAGKNNPMYGVHRFGDKNPFFGRNHSEETKLRISKTKTGRTLPEEHKAKIRKSTPRGDKSPHWRGGPGEDLNTIRVSTEYRQWAYQVKKRDGFKCVQCGISIDDCKLNADHIKPFSLFPELRFELSNGRTLCVPCHKKTDTYGWSLYWRKKSKEIYIERTMIKL